MAEWRVMRSDGNLCYLYWKELGINGSVSLFMPNHRHVFPSLEHFHLHILRVQLSVSRGPLGTLLIRSRRLLISFRTPCISWGFAARILPAHCGYKEMLPGELDALSEQSEAN